VDQIDFDEVMIDGAFPAEVRARMARLLESRPSSLDLSGIPSPAITQRSFGGIARAVGAAARHISDRYMVRHELRDL
jgi:hypothetical protein